MKAIEIVTTNGLREEVEVCRLSAADRADAIDAFVQYRLGVGAGNEEYDAFAAGCQVLYYDDEDGRSWYQVVDARGHSDGSGEWTEVDSE